MPLATLDQRPHERRTMNQPLPAPVAAASGAKAKVFVSYSRKDLAFAQMLVAALAGRGFDAFLDKTDIAPGEPWQERLAGLIASADTVVLAVSPDSVASNVCSWELEESARRGKRLIPVVARRIADDDAPPALRRLNWVFCAEGDDQDAALAALDTALHTDLPWVREHTRLGELARRWDEQGRRKGASLRGADLDAAERWLDRRPADANAPTDLHQDFIRASRRAATARQRWWVGGSLGIAVLALGLAGFAELNRREAQTQRERAERTLTAATDTANGLVTNLAKKFRNTVGVPVATIKDILDRARQLQDQLLGSGESRADLRKSQADALLETSRTLVAIGETESALATARQAHDIFQALLAQQPDGTAYRVGLSLSYDRIGAVLLAQDSPADALKAYQAGLAINEQLAKAQPTNADRQRDLAVAYQRIGTVLIQQTAWPEALKAFRDSLAIFDRLAKADPDNVRLQRDLGVTDQKIGDVLVAQHDLPGALASYRDGVAVFARLAGSDPGNAQWQRDLEVLQGKEGDVLQAQRNLPEALASYQAALAINIRLAASDPGNAAWQRDLALSYNSVGDVLAAQGKPAEALKSYQAGLDIIERLAKSDPSNAGWLSSSYQRVGDALTRQRNFAEALKAFRSNVEISERLAKADPSNAVRQMNLSLAYNFLGDVLGAQGNFAEALDSFLAGFSIRERLATSAPGNADWQSKLAFSYSKLAGVYQRLDRLDDMRHALDAGREIEVRLVAAYPNVAQYKRELDWFERQIAAAKN
jgi:tetratricopeptide (TPR) repeat protein